MREPYLHQPAQPVFSDSRSAVVDMKRRRKDQSKYLGYQTVTPGQVGQPHYTGFKCGKWTEMPADFGQCAITTLSKRQLFKEAQETRPHWLPRHHHARSDKKYKWAIRDAEHQERTACKEAQAWSKKHSQAAFVDSELDDLNYEQQAALDAELSLLDCTTRDSVYAEDVPHVPQQHVDFAPLIDKAVIKREKRRRRAMQRLGWTDAAEDLDIGYPGDEWMDLVIEHLEIDPISEFELV